MIGDHQQLRPKCQHYPLTVESNRGFDLNRSLFERLAIAPGFRLATLGVQHRMHPDISSIPRLVTYEDLADAPNVSSHAVPLGLDSRVIFVNHEHPEDEQHVDSLESVSKTNAHERAMIVKTVEYVLKQGYAPEDIVVLTPYLGQMLKLHTDLGKCVGASLDERDINDAREQFRGDDNFSEELSAAKQGKGKSEAKPAIRVATIDNYQGEEAKIVLISLVRSN
jgi:superfamily I DNA and/or RNA helicase